MKRDLLWFTIFTSLGGIILGFAISRLPSSPFGWSAVYVLLGGLAARTVVSLVPHGSLNLSPLVFLVVTLTSGVWLGIAVAVMAPILAASWSIVSLSSRKLSLMELLSSAGEAAAALVFASAALLLLGRVELNLWRVAVFSVSSLLMLVALQAMRISILERIKLDRVIGLLYGSSVPHITAFVLAVALSWATVGWIGPFGIVLTSIVAIEMYYPWKLLGEQRDLFLKSLQMISNAVDLKDPYTAHHSRRVAQYATMMARVLDLDEAEVERIRIGALMHDIGKVAVPGAVIRKPSRLTDEEMNLMRAHVEAGANIVEGLEVLGEATDIVRHHHENYDGSGYPSGLKGAAIPLGARIVFVADAFDALTTDRPYRKGRSLEEAMRILEANVDTQFDRRAVGALRSVIGRAG
jgi:putative nucleotidyltransferase with HDIG domain